MMEKKKVDEDVNPPFDGERQEDEERQPSWIQKYLDLAPTGPNAETAKAMMAQLGATVQTNFKAAPTQQKKKQ